MNFHSKNESTKTQVSETFFWKKKKKKTRKSFCVEKKKEKMQFMEIAIFNITSYLHSVLTIFKPRESAAGMAQIHLQRISAFQRAEPLIVLQLRTSFVSLLPLP